MRVFELVIHVPSVLLERDAGPTRGQVTIDPLRILASDSQRLIARNGRNREICDRAGCHHRALLDPIVANVRLNRRRSWRKAWPMGQASSAAVGSGHMNSVVGADKVRNAMQGIDLHVSAARPRRPSL